MLLKVEKLNKKQNVNKIYVKLKVEKGHPKVKAIKKLISLTFAYLPLFACLFFFFLILLLLILKLIIKSETCDQ